MTWQTAILGEVATIDRSGTNPTDLPQDCWYIGLEHIERGGRIVGRQTLKDAELSSTKFRFSSEHVLYGKLRPYLGKIARPEFNGVCSTDILPIKPGHRLDRDFLTHYLRQEHMVNHASSRAAGANLPRLAPTELAKFPIPLPPLDEQRRIASILDQADILRAKRRQQLAHLDALPKSKYLEVFGHIEASTTVQSLAAERGSIRTGPFGSQLLHSEFTDSGIAVLGLDNVIPGEFSWGQRRFISAKKFEKLRRYRAFPGDVLVSIMGTVGRCVVVPQDIPEAITTKHLCAITVNQDEIHPEFLRASFLWHPASRQYLTQRTKGSVMDGLNMAIIRELPVPLPPMTQQLRFGEFLKEVRRLQSHLQEDLESCNRLFTSLQSRAFRGEL